MRGDALSRAACVTISLVLWSGSAVAGPVFPWDSEAPASRQLARCQPGAADGACEEPLRLDAKKGCVGEKCDCKPNQTCGNKCDLTIWDGCVNVRCKCPEAEDVVCFKNQCCTKRKCTPYQCNTPNDGCGGRLKCGYACPGNRKCNPTRHVCE